jgi:hypothetical protein
MNYNFFLNTLLNKLQDHVFICSIWINFEKENIHQNLNFLNNSMLNIIKFKKTYLLIKFWNGLVVKALMCFHEVSSSNLDECVYQCTSYKCNAQTLYIVAIDVKIYFWQN